MSWYTCCYLVDPLMTSSQGKLIAMLWPKFLMNLVNSTQVIFLQYHYRLQFTE